MTTISFTPSNPSVALHSSCAPFIARHVGRKRKSPRLPPLSITTTDKPEQLTQAPQQPQLPQALAALSCESAQVHRAFVRGYLHNTNAQDPLAPPAPRCQQAEQRYLCLHALALELYFSADDFAQNTQPQIGLNLSLLLTPNSPLPNHSIYASHNAQRQALAKARLKLWARLLGHNTLDQIAQLMLWNAVVPQSAWPYLRARLDLAAAIFALSAPQAPKELSQ